MTNERMAELEDLLVRCNCCGGTVIFKREGNEIVFFHACCGKYGQAIGEDAALEEFHKRGEDLKRYRAALASAALSLYDYARSYDARTGDEEAREAAKLMGWEGGSDMDLRDFLMENIYAK